MHKQTKEIHLEENVNANMESSNTMPAIQSENQMPNAKVRPNTKIQIICQTEVNTEKNVLQRNKSH